MYCICYLVDLPHQYRYWIDSSASRIKPISECNLQWFFPSNQESGERWPEIELFTEYVFCRIITLFYRRVRQCTKMIKEINNWTLTLESRWNISLLVIFICIDPRENFLLVYFRIDPVVNLCQNFCVVTLRQVWKSSLLTIVKLARHNLHAWSFPQCCQVAVATAK